MVYSAVWLHLGRTRVLHLFYLVQVLIKIPIRWQNLTYVIAYLSVLSLCPWYSYIRNQPCNPTSFRFYLPAGLILRKSADSFVGGNGISFHLLHWVTPPYDLMEGNNLAFTRMVDSATVEATCNAPTHWTSKRWFKNSLSSSCCWSKLRKNGSVYRRHENQCLPECGPATLVMSLPSKATLPSMSKILLLKIPG